MRGGLAGQLRRPFRRPPCAVHGYGGDAFLTVRPAGVLAVTLAACWLAVAAFPPAGRSASRASGGHGGRLVISPRARQAVRSDVVEIAVRSTDESARLQARLNGIAIGGAFTPVRRGVRRLAASLSYGLRR